MIYGVFINLGLPDSLLGVAWPVMQPSFGVPYSFAGIVSMIISFGTVISSLSSVKLIKLFGTGKIVLISVFLTASALLGFSFSQSFIWIVLMAIPLGFGAGCVDSAINGYVAKFYTAKHMNWLHCFWGIGALISPIIMSFFIKDGSSWRNGYLIVSLIQFVFVIILFFALPLWDKINKTKIDEKLEVKAEENNSYNPFFVFKLKGAIPTLITFLLYCGVESTMGLWGSSYLVKIKDVSPTDAALWVSGFFTFITIGRFVSGVVSIKFSNKTLVRIGQVLIFAGVLFLFIPLKIFTLLGFLAIGFGCAPIFPSLLHETPRRFGESNAQFVMGLQMSTAYIGSTFLAPFFGFVTSKISVGFFPVFLLVYIVVMFLANEMANKATLSISQNC